MNSYWRVQKGLLTLAGILESEEAGSLRKRSGRRGAQLKLELRLRRQQRNGPPGLQSSQASAGLWQTAPAGAPACTPSTPRVQYSSRYFTFYCAATQLKSQLLSPVA